MLIRKLPLPVALSLVVMEWVALTEKDVVPAGLAADVFKCRVTLLDVSAAAKLTEVLGVKELVTPDGKVPISVKFAVNEPEDPGPDPRFTVMVYVELPAVPYVTAPV